MKNRIIWTYWHQGFEQAPKIVQNCVKQWQLLHPNWKIEYLDRKNVYNFIDSLPISNDKLNHLTLPHHSDLIRTQLLIQYGGVWADPTCFPLMALDEWLPENMESGLFLFHKPGRDRLISNWFIAAEKENEILKKLLNELCQYWDNNEFLNEGGKKIRYEPWVNRIYNRSLWSTQLWFTWFTRKVIKLYPYMVYHYKFYQIITKDAQSMTQWANMTKISADGPHRLQRIGLLSPCTIEAKEIIDNKKFPLFKLSWKIQEDTWSKQSVIGYLFNKRK